MKREEVSRRGFLRESTTLAAGVVTGVVLSEGYARQECANSPDGGTPITNENPRMKYRRLGRTGLMISEIVLGGHFSDPQGALSWDRFTTGEVPPHVTSNRMEVVSRCIDCGINYLDVTRSSEALAYGVALKGRRDKMHIAADDAEYAMRVRRQRNAKGQMQSIESCLTKLRTDYLDIWRPQFQPLGGHRDLDLELCIEVFEKARKQGKVRFLGMATHDRVWMQRVVERFPQYTVVYVPYTLRSRVTPADPRSIDRSQLYEPHDQPWSLGRDRPSLFEAARAQDTGVIAMKPFSAGLIFSAVNQGFADPDRATQSDEELARLTLAYILGNPDISGVAVGMRLPAYVDNNVRAVTERQALLNPTTMRTLADHAGRMGTRLSPEYAWLKQWEHV